MKKHALWAFVRKGAYPHVSLVAAGCAQAIRLVGGMAAFDRRKIEDFKFKAIARGIDKINQSSRCNFKAAFIGSSTRSRLLASSYARGPESFEKMGGGGWAASSSNIHRSQGCVKAENTES